MKRIAAVMIILALLTGGGFFFFKGRGGRSVEATTAAPAAVAVDAAYPERATLRRTVEVYGSLNPKNSTDLKSEVPGRVLHVRVKEWDHVKPGDVLLELDPVDFNLDFQRTEAGLGMAKAQLLQARVELNRAKREWDRARNLLKGRLIAAQEHDQRKSDLEAAEARVALAEAQVAQAEAQVAEAARSLQKAVITAPIEGTVSQRKVDVGDFVDKGELLFSIVDNRVLDFTANISATDLSHVAEGQKLTFTVDGIPNRDFEGRVKRVNPVVSSADRTGRIQAEVQNPDGVLKGGLYARGQVVVEVRENAMVVPRAALMGWNILDRTARVFVVEDGGTVASRPIETGLGDGSVVEVKSGLAGTEAVVVRGGFNIREGDRAVVVNRASDGASALQEHGKSAEVVGGEAKSAAMSALETGAQPRKTEVDS